ncbi:MAG: hypothetical protein JRF61_26160 [Deltaproteobacteria bacterium]|jgi:hypothetical protein|nr:hypothetical protein [Deltaproteobacteria bacterium]
MDPAEYLAFVPLLFYGIALADLLGQWRRFFDREYFYLPYFLTTVVFTELAIWNVYGYLAVVHRLDKASYLQYWAYLLQPMLFLLTVSALTPDSEERDTEEYFTKRLSLIYGLMAAFIFSHLLSSYEPRSSLVIPRLIGTVLCIAVAVTRRLEIIYVLLLVWLVGLVRRL